MAKQVMGKGENLVLHKSVYEMVFKDRNIFIDIFMVLFGVALLGIMANIRIPLWPVPVTLQTFGVIFLAFFFGSLRGFLLIVSYILSGIVGFGVFAGKNSGIGAILGPTGGYIIGFLFCNNLCSFPVFFKFLNHTFFFFLKSGGKNFFMLT